MILDKTIDPIYDHPDGLLQESQTTLEVIRNISVALGVTANELIFGKDARGHHEDLRLQFEAISKFTDEDKRTVKEVLEGLILKNEAKKWG